MTPNLLIAFVIGFVFGSAGEWVIIGWSLFNVLTAGLAGGIVYAGFTLIVEVMRK